ncbi:unnamed protein product [Rhizopus stolonifer]
MEIILDEGKLSRETKDTVDSWQYMYGFKSNIGKRWPICVSTCIQFFLAFLN